MWALILLLWQQESQGVTTSKLKDLQKDRLALKSWFQSDTFNSLTSFSLFSFSQNELPSYDSLEEKVGEDFSNIFHLFMLTPDRITESSFWWLSSLTWLWLIHETLNSEQEFEEDTPLHCKALKKTTPPCRKTCQILFLMVKMHQDFLESSSWKIYT